MGHGDVTVNKKMKDLNQIFHDLLIKFIDKDKSNKIKINEMTKFLFLTKKNEISIKLMNILPNIIIFVLILLIKI